MKTLETNLTRIGNAWSIKLPAALIHKHRLEHGVLVEEREGEIVLKPVGLLTCPDTSATAEAFVSYYGQSPSVDTPYLIPKLRQPTLVLVAGSDEVVPGLAQKMTQIADGLRVKMKIIDGADHTFRDIYTDEAVDAIDGFLKSVWR